MVNIGHMWCHINFLFNAHHVICVCIVIAFLHAQVLLSSSYIDYSNITGGGRTCSKFWGHNKLARYIYIVKN